MNGLLDPPADVLAAAETFPELIPGTAPAVAAICADLSGLDAEAIRSELDRRIWGEDRLLHFLRCSHAQSEWHERQLRAAVDDGRRLQAAFDGLPLPLPPFAKIDPEDF